jgi:hypothetical protein
MTTSGRIPPLLPRGIRLSPILSLGLACGLAFGLATSGNRAEAADPEALIREGIELRRARDDLSALKRFQQAYEISKSPKAIAQVGLAEQALGRWATADKHLHQALQSVDDPWIQKYRSAIDQALAVVSTHVGRLDVTGRPAGADVRVDGELVGHLPLTEPITVTAGGLALEVRAAGHLPIVRATTVAAGLLTRENFNLQPLSPAAEAGSLTPGRRAPDAGPASSAAGPTPDGPRLSMGGGGTQTQPDAVGPSSAAPAGSEAPSGGHPAPGDGARSHGILTLTAAGLAAVSLAFGVVEHLSWQGKVNSFDSMNTCGGSLPDKGSQGCKQLYDDGQRAKILAFVGYGIGAAFVATAVVLYVTDSGRSSDARALACAPNPITAGADCAVRF